MTDSEIIKALECCIDGYCRGCMYGETLLMTCKDDLMREALALINRQKAEIERLNLENLQMVASIKRLTNEAIKEFAERLEECRVIQTANMSGYIDNLVKEMECGNDAKRSSNT